MSTEYPAMTETSPVKDKKWWIKRLTEKLYIGTIAKKDLGMTYLNGKLNYATRGETISSYFVYFMMFILLGNYVLGLNMRLSVVISYLVDIT